MSDFRLKFAVVREDPLIDIKLAKESHVRNALLVASGGDTAFAFVESLPKVSLTLFDFNPVQLEHVAQKAQAIERGELSALGVDNDSPSSLHQCGDFESLFRLLRSSIIELVAPKVADWFNGSEAVSSPGDWFLDPYWPVCFELAFHDRLLETMFGPDAIQHAPPGSYPGYFQGVFENGLRRKDARNNPFLQHIFLQKYNQDQAPSYLQTRRPIPYTAILGQLTQIDIAAFDFVHLSNLFDWCDDATVAAHCDHLQTLPEGAVVVIRQLNNQRDLAPFLGGSFQIDIRHDLQQVDRSLFYNRILTATKMRNS